MDCGQDRNVQESTQVGLGDLDLAGERFAP